MQHQINYRKLGRDTAHRTAMLRNMVTSLILSDRLETTLTRAKELRRVAEQMVTLGKKGSLAARRKAAITVRDSSALQKLFSTLSERFKDRNGGYTRIIRLGDRRGDAAPMAIIEYLSAEGEVAAAGGAPSAKKPRKAKAATKAAAAPTAKAKSKAATKPKKQASTATKKTAKKS